jgi:hypothetical protein
MMQDGGLEDFWLVDSGGSWHMTGTPRWYSSLIPVMHEQYITFGDFGRGSFRSVRSFLVNDDFVLSDVVLIDSLLFDLVSLVH